MKRFPKQFLSILLTLLLILSFFPAVSAEPSRQNDADYYLFGSINGANYGCEEDWKNLGIYHFVDGKLTATFAEDSYIGVKTGDNAHWYMTDGWLGTDVKSATLYNADEYAFSGEKNKLYVPSGVELEFTLVVNSDDSLVLSYTTGSTTPDPDPDPDPDPGELSPYYLTGGMNGWNTQDSAYRLREGENEGEYVLKNLKLEQNTELKIVNPTTNTWYPGGANYKVTENGVFDLSFYPAGGQTGYYEGYFKLTKVGEYTPDPTDVIYYLTGTFAGWGAKEAYKLVPGENEGEFVISGVTLPAGAGVKVMSSKNAWFPSGTGNELVLTSDGVYDVSFYPAGGVDGYYEGYFKLTRVGGYIPGDHTGADDKVILHCWNWSFDEIREHLPQIAAAGYTTVQTSPAQPHSGYFDGEVGTGDWWMLYQPLGLHIAQEGQSWLGDADDLKALCDAAHALGVEVIVDVVANHICNGYNDIAADGTDPRAADQIVASSGGKVGYRFEIQPDSRVAIYNPELFTEGPTRYFRDYVFCNDETTESVVHGNIGMPDFKTEEPAVQQSVLAYLKELIDVGVDGFRFDAAKHIETPNDGEYSSDFWPTVIGGAEEYAESKGKTVWSYGEVLSTAGKTRKMNDYAPYIDMTEISYAYTITQAFGDHKGANAVASQLFKDWLGVGVETLKNSSLVLMAESHDMYAQGSDSFSRYGTEVINKAWAVAAARADTSSLYFARPFGYKYETNDEGETYGVPYGTLGKCDNFDWMNPEVAAVNHFHTAFVGAEEDVYASGELVVVERYNETDSGVVLVNANGNSTSVYLTVRHMTDGTWYDQITGNEFTVSSGKLTGEMGPNGIVVLGDTEPDLCEHPADQRSTTVTEPTCIEPGWTYTYCDVCHQLLSKAESAPALGHIDENGDKYCDRCGEFLGTIKVYFVDTNDWISKNNSFDCVRWHAWNDSGNSTTWPGNDMEIVGRTKDDHGIWLVEMNPEKYTKIIFNAGENGAHQTVNLSYVEDAGANDVVIYTAEYEPAGRTFDGTEKLYVNTAAETWWTNGGAILHMTLTREDGSKADLILNQEDGAVYSAVIPAGSYLTLNLSRYNPNYDPESEEEEDHTEVWNRTGEIAIPPQVNYVESFADGSDSAEWGFWPSGSYESVHAEPGAVLKDICGHTSYEIVSGSGVERWICDCCGETFRTVPLESFLFDDVRDENKFYFEPVYWALRHDPQITTGTSDTMFSPNKDCTRGQVVTFLWRAAGEPEPSSTTCSFTDVKASAYYYKAMLWAVENNITTGTSATTFSPNKACTRGQVVTFLWRYAGEPAAQSTAHPFTDVKEGGYYYNAMLWAVGCGVTTGTSATTFSPNKNCNRGQVVTFLYRVEQLNAE